MVIATIRIVTVTAIVVIERVIIITLIIAVIKIMVVTAIISNTPVTAFKTFVKVVKEFTLMVLRTRTSGKRIKKSITATAAIITIAIIVTAIVQVRLH